MDIAKQLVEELQKRGQIIATAESCTGGTIAGAITSVPGASDVFGYGIVSYSNEAKMKILGVNKETLDAHGAVSEETAVEMAAGVRYLSRADFALSVTGIAGPGGGTAEKPVGLVYIGISTKEGTFGVKNLFKGNRDEIRHQTLEKAISLVLTEITKQS